MDNQKTPPSDSFLKRLESLSEAAHFFLNEQNRNGLYKGWSYDTVTANLQQVVFGFNLVDLLDEKEADFEKLLFVLDQFLSSTDENQLESVVPTEVLDNLKEILDEENLKNEELLEKIRAENKERLNYLKRLNEIQKRLKLKFDQLLVTEEELQSAVPKIIDEITPEISLLAKEAQKARENEELREIIREKGQKIFLQAVRKNNEIPPTVKEYLSSREISAETFIQLTENQVFEQNKILLNSISSFTPEEVTLLKENIIPAIAVNIANLSSKTTTSEEINEIIAVSLSQELEEIKNISSDKILNFVKEIAPETQEIITKDNLPTFSSAVSPTIVEGKNKVFISLTSPPISGNPQGEVYKLTDDNKTLGQDFLKNLKNGTLRENFNQIKEKVSERINFKLSIQGISSKALDQKAFQNRLKGSPESLQKAAYLSTFSENLKQFQQKFFFKSSLPEQWIANKISSLQIFQQISSFTKSGFTKGITSALEKVGLQTAQKGLQTLWNTAKTGAGKAIAGGITKILSKLGFQALATAIAPGIANLIAFFAPKILKEIKKGLGKIGNLVFFPIGIANSILGKVTGNEGEDKNSKWLIYLFVGLFVVIFFLPLIVFAGVIGGAFVGGTSNRSGSSWPNPTFPDIQCAPSRHLGEEVVCQLTQREDPCNQTYIQFSNWQAVERCFNKQETNFQGKEIVKDRFQRMVSNPDLGYHIHCLGFVLAIKEAMGESFEINGRGSASDYGFTPYPPNYIPVTVPQLGDLVVWGNIPPGHIAIYLGAVADSTSKMVVVEANFGEGTGELAVRARLNESYGAGPSLFLHYQR